MFLTEKVEPDYLAILTDLDCDKLDKVKAVGNLLRLHKFSDLFLNYEKYKDIIEDDECLANITRYCLGLRYSLNLDFAVLEFIRTYFKTNTRFPKNKFSSDYKYLLRLRDSKRYINVNYILDNQL